MAIKEAELGGTRGNSGDSYEFLPSSPEFLRIRMGEGLLEQEIVPQFLYRTFLIYPSQSKGDKEIIIEEMV